MAAAPVVVDYDPDLSKGVHYEVLPADDFERSTKSFKCGFVKLKPYNQVLPRCFLPYEKRLKDFDCRADDVWVASFPKCGTTWMQETVWCIMNDCDFEGAAQTILDERVPFLEFISLVDPLVCPDGVQTPDTISVLDEKPLEERRLIKTHLSSEMLPRQIAEKGCKMVYVARNPRDTCVSYMNHWRVLEGYEGDLPAFADAFLADRCGYYTPFFGHVLGYWERSKTDENLMFVTYEEMKGDLEGVVKRLGTFLGKPVSDRDMPALLEHLSFDKMKTNAMVNKQNLVDTMSSILQVDLGRQGFMRQGQAGNWKKHFTPQMRERFERWEEEWLQGSDLKFTYEL